VPIITEFPNGDVGSAVDLNWPGPNPNPAVTPEHKRYRTLKMLPALLENVFSMLTIPSEVERRLYKELLTSKLKDAVRIELSTIPVSLPLCKYLDMQSLSTCSTAISLLYVQYPG
jgi:hypothetical protein